MNFVRHCFQEMHSQHNQHGCPYLHWFYRMARDTHLEQLFQLFDTEIEGQYVHKHTIHLNLDYLA